MITISFKIGNELFYTKIHKINYKLLQDAVKALNGKLVNNTSKKGSQVTFKNGGIYF